MSASPLQLEKPKDSEHVEREEAVPPDAPEMSEELRTALESLVTSVMREEKTPRRSEVRNAFRLRLYCNGIQHIWYDKTSYTYMLPEASNQELPQFMDTYDITSPHKRNFVAILSQNPPGINFVPNDLQRGVDVTAASYAEKMRHRVDRLVHMKDRQMEAAGYFCTDGRTITRTYLDSNGKLRITLHGVLESKVPIFARKMERWGYCVLSEECDQYEAKDEFPDFADDIEPSVDPAAEASYERYARMGVLANRRGGGFGDISKHIVTKHIAWIRPSRYRKLPKEVQKEAKSLFENGVRCTVIADTCVEAVAETMEEALRVEWPSAGQGQNRPALLHGLPPIQDAYNDIKNMQRENADYGIPGTWYDESAIDSEAVAEQKSEPAAKYGMNPPGGKSVSDCVFQEAPAELSAQTVAMLDALLQDAQFTTGDVPSLFGEGTPDQETASGQKMLSDQAKGQLSSAWSGIQWLFAGTYELAVKIAARIADQDSIAVQGGNGQDRFNPSAILDGEWGCYPDTDSSFPETMADKRASLQMVLSQLGSSGDTGVAIVTQPDNLKLIKQYSGLTDLIIPGAEARDKQLREIEQLLQEPPVIDDAQMPQYTQGIQQAHMQWQQTALQAQQAGQPIPPQPQIPPPPMKSSVDVDVDWDYHQPEADKVQEWLSSTACREEMQKGNMQGVQNVKLHGQAHRAAIKSQQMPAPTEPAKLSGTFTITDPNAITQILAKDGITTSPDAIAASQQPDIANTNADTQEKGATAIHKSVLAAKEQVEPVQRNVVKMPDPQTPDNGSLGEK